MMKVTRYHRKMLGLISGLSVGLLALSFFVELSAWLVAGLAVGMLILTSLIFGSEHSRWRERSGLVFIVIALCGIWLIVEYLCGIWLGYQQNGYFRLTPFLATTLPFAICVVATELLRANLTKKADRNRLAIVLVWLLVTIIGALFIRSTWLLSTNLKFTEFIFIDILPWIAQSIFLTLLVRKGGFAPAITFRAMTALPVLILPYVVNFNDYLLSCANLLLPVIGFYLIRRATKERDAPASYHRTSKTAKVAYGTLMALLIAGVIALSSGLFKYYPLTIASGSMTPNIHIGDMVIVKKLNYTEMADLAVGDILVFTKQDKTIVHRIAEKGLLLDAPYFITKGDANKENDNWTVPAEEVIGTTSVKIPFIGYPTLWVHDVLEGYD
jgi:signal peptidase I